MSIKRSKAIINRSEVSGLFFTLLLAAVCNTLALAAPGDLDGGFGGGGVVYVDFLDMGPDADGSDATALAIQPDGAIIVGGVRHSLLWIGTSWRHWAFTRLLPDGGLDMDFGSSGKRIDGSPASARLTDLLVQPDGRTLAVGWLLGVDGYEYVIRYRADGGRDTAFGSNGSALLSPSLDGIYPSAVALQPGGKIVVAGFGFSGRATSFAARFTADGKNLDEGFGMQGVLLGESLADMRAVSDTLIQPDGKLLLAGGKGDQAALVRLNPDGLLDNGFGTGGLILAGDMCEAPDGPPTWQVYIEGSFVNLALQPDGRILAIGMDCNHVHTLVARYLADGSPDPSFGTGGHVRLPYSDFAGGTLALQPDGKIIVAGSTGAGHPKPYRSAIGRLNPDGSYSGFSADGWLAVLPGSVIADTALQPDGRIVAAGSTPGGGEMLILRLQGDALDLTPDTIEFMQATGVSPGSLATSSLATVSGLSDGAWVPILVSGGEYSLNGSMQYTDRPGHVRNGDLVSLRHRAADGHDTAVQTVARIGGLAAPDSPTTLLGTPIEAVFVSRTVAALPGDGGDGDGGDGSNGGGNDDRDDDTATPGRSGGGGGLNPAHLSILLTMLALRRALVIRTL